MSSYARFTYLLDRVGSWPIEDLADLMIEVRRDGELDEEQRRALLERVYALLWERAQSKIQRGGWGDARAK